MADPINPLVDPDYNAPATSYDNPLLQVMADISRHHQADNHRELAADLMAREKLAQTFEGFSKDPRFSKYPDLQTRALAHANVLRTMDPRKKLPTQYKADPKEGVPALNDLLWQHTQREMQRTGEPPEPPEVSEPPEPSSSMSGMGMMPVSNGGGAGAGGGSVPPPPAPSGIAGQPGGVHLGPNQITPAPAVPTPAAGIPSQSAAPQQSPQSAVPAMPAAPAPIPHQSTMMTPPEQAAFLNSIPASAAPEIARAMGVDPDDPNALIDLRALKGSSTLLGKNKDFVAKMAKLGLDEEGNKLPDDKLPPEVAYKNHLGDLADARAQLARAHAISDPSHRAAEEQHWRVQAHIAQQNADTAAGKLGLDKQLYGLGGSGTGDNTPGGDDDKLVHTTISGRKYIDLSNYKGKLGSSLALRYEQAGIPAVQGPAADRLSEIDNARMNQDSVYSAISSKLPKDAMGRIIGGSSNTIEQFLQTDKDLAAYDSYRTVAISTLKALAGSKGLRINQAEIELSLKNDIPSITDTVDTAMQKFANIQHVLSNAESSILVHNRQGMKGATNDNPVPNPPAPGGINGAAPPPQDQRVVGKTKWTAPDGREMIWMRSSKGKFGWAPNK